MSNYLYKTTDDTVIITTPEPPGIFPGETGIGGGGGYPPPSSPPPSPPGGDSSDYLESVISVDEDGDGKIDHVIICGMNGCSMYPY